MRCDQVELDLVALADAPRFPCRRRVCSFLASAPSASACLGLVLELLEAAIDGELELLADLVALVEVLGLEVGQVLVALVLVDPGDQVGGEVDDLLELLGLQLFLRLDAGEQVGQPRAGAAQVPDVHDRSASSMWPMRSRRTFERVTSTPQRSQMMPLKRTRLYLPQ